MQELIGHFEEHSLGIYFPSINTVLRYPYKEEQYNGQSMCNYLIYMRLLLPSRISVRRMSQARK